MLREFVNFSKFKLLQITNNTNTKNILITVAKTSEKVCRLNITSRLKVKVENVEKITIVEKVYNKTVIDFNFGGHNDLSTL